MYAMRCYLNKDSPIPRRNSTRPNRLLYSTSGPEDKENVPIRKTGKTRLEDNENVGENAEITYNKDTTLDTLNPDASTSTSAPPSRHSPSALMNAMALMNGYSSHVGATGARLTPSDNILKGTPPASARVSPVSSPSKRNKTPTMTPPVGRIPVAVTTVTNPSPSDASVNSSLNSSTDTVSPPPRVPSPLAFYGMLGESSNSSSTSAATTPVACAGVKKEKPVGATWEDLVKCLEYTNSKGRVVVERVMSEEGRVEEIKNTKKMFVEEGGVEEIMKSVRTVWESKTGVSQPRLSLPAGVKVKDVIVEKVLQEGVVVDKELRKGFRKVMKNLIRQNEERFEEFMTGQ
ncbi:hypothetical protein TrRE_jg9037 [Triparma retinervis]|uniref:Uncharacterized protein n=1 Tax=Triparma retinervis TaxID=2557542 RepID=A0A9W6Z3G6_9STRA|nr:hypothetical protein TrRE_jg9037 [Triparma retinervis]